jgi:hypothetical protein
LAITDHIQALFRFSRPTTPLITGKGRKHSAAQINDDNFIVPLLSHAVHEKSVFVDFSVISNLTQAMLRASRPI